MIVPRDFGVIPLKRGAGCREKNGVPVLHDHERFIFHAFAGVDSDVTLRVKLPFVQLSGADPIALGDEFKAAAPGVLNVLEVGVTVKHGGGQLPKGLLKSGDGVIEFFQRVLLTLGFRAVVRGVNLPALHGNAFDKPGIEHAQETVRVDDLVPDEHLPGKGSTPRFVPGVNQGLQVGAL